MTSSTSMPRIFSPRCHPMHLCLPKEVFACSLLPSSLFALKHVLIRADLIVNPMQYLRLCTGFRSDVQLLSMEHMTFDWFVPNEAHLYPNVTFPGPICEAVGCFLTDRCSRSSLSSIQAGWLHHRAVCSSQCRQV